MSHAKNPKAPVAPKTDVICGKIRVKIPAKNRLTATERLIPTSVLDQSDYETRERRLSYHDGIKETLRQNR